jgi:transposase
VGCGTIAIYRSLASFEGTAQRMLNFMDRSTIYFLHQKGWTNLEIAEFVGHHRDTIARVLREGVDCQPPPRQRTSAIALFDAQIRTWLDQKWTVQRMLEVARTDPDHPYTGSAAAFYDYVRPIKRARKGVPGLVPIRFEGLPGELLQIDWGEVRHFAFTRPNLLGKTRYFFAARLKYSRFMWVRFTTDMREETLLRCLIACFVELAGVPWVVTTDNMKTITLGRDEAREPIWHPAFQKCACEFGFLPAVCTPTAANQKGAVENLVKFVKGNFLIGRSFYDDADLHQEAATWLQQVNDVRPSDATEQLPSVLLAAERPHFGPLPAVASDYGFFDTVKVSRESLVAIATNRYSVPAELVGLVLSARIYAARIELYHGSKLVATHVRQFTRNTRTVIPEHYEAMFAHKPRARVMVYRDFLVGLSEAAAAYVSQLCRKRYAEMDAQILALYRLTQQVARDELLAALELALEQQTFGAEYMQALLATPRRQLPRAEALTERMLTPLLAVPQHSVERELALYEQYVANREQAHLASGGML